MQMFETTEWQRRLAGPVAVAALGAMSLAGCANEPHPDAGCYNHIELQKSDIQLDAIRFFKSQQIAIDNLSGLRSASHAITNELEALHHKYDTILPNDVYSLCIESDGQILPGQHYAATGEN